MAKPEGKLHYQDLGIFSGWVEEARKQKQLFPFAEPGPETQRILREVLGFSSGPEMPLDAQIDRSWECNGLVGESISWSVGYGPRTQAWLLKPAGASGPLPGVVALHDHGGFKVLGKEKIAAGPEDVPPYVQNWWQKLYGGQAFADALAHEGFAVLIPDTFLWGSRRFEQKHMPPWTEEAFSGLKNSSWLDMDIPYEVGLYNFSAAQHEHQIEKYCHILGTTLAGVVSHEDRVAVNYLRGRSDVNAERIGCIGLSGGGARAALLQATHDHIRAAVIVGMMASYEYLLDKYVMPHTWMLFPAGWSQYGDWPDLAACRTPSPLLVQYNTDDELFSREAMIAADQRLATHYRNTDDAYQGEFYPGPHKFDLDMQQSAFAWLKRQLSQKV